MLQKIFGAISFLVGVLIVILFPDLTRYQPASMAAAGVIVGFGLIGFGIYLMKT